MGILKEKADDLKYCRNEFSLWRLVDVLLIEMVNNVE